MSMWLCPNCNESIEETLDLCWNCGTARDGTIDPNFEREFVGLPPNNPASESDNAESDAVSGSSADGGMNRREIASLICKTLGLLMFAQVAFFGVTAAVVVLFHLFSTPFRGWLSGPEIFASLILCIPAIATLIVGMVYWQKSDAIASRMVDANPTSVTSVSITVRDVMRVAFSTAGLFILVDGVRDFVGVIALAHTYRVTTSEFWYNSSTWKALVQLGFGLWLILGARGIIGAIHWLRVAGDPNAEGQSSFRPDD